VVTVAIHNCASIPVTITGVDATPSGWGGAISGPTIRNGSNRKLRPVKGTFRHVCIGPDAHGAVKLILTRIRGRPAARHDRPPLLTYTATANARTGKVPMPSMGGGTA
jgi:hypothetical protein